jgi:hypothetical protein
MNALKLGIIAATICLSTAAFAASDNSISGSGDGTTANQPGALSGQTDAARPMKEGRAMSKSSPNNSPQDAPTGVGGAPNSTGTPSVPTTKEIRV